MFGRCALTPVECGRPALNEAEDDGREDSCLNEAVGKEHGRSNSATPLASLPQRLFRKRST